MQASTTIELNLGHFLHLIFVMEKKVRIVIWLTNITPVSTFVPSSNMLKLENSLFVLRSSYRKRNPGVLSQTELCSRKCLL